MAASLSFALIKRKIFPTSGIVRNIFSIKAVPLNIYSQITMLAKLTSSIAVSYEIHLFIVI